MIKYTTIIAFLFSVAYGGDEDVTSTGSEAESNEPVQSSFTSNMMVFGKVFTIKD